MIVNLLSRFPTYYLHLFTNITAIKKTCFCFYFSQVWLESRLFASYPPTPALAKAGAALGSPQVWHFSFLVHPAANRHPKATHQWLLMGVQACRLPALKRLKPLKTFKALKTLKTLTTLHGGPSLPFAMLHPASNRHPKATHQWLLMGVQACRLPCP